MLGLVQSKIQKGSVGGGGNITIDKVEPSHCIVITNTTGISGYIVNETTLNVSGACYWYLIELGGAV